MQAFRLFNWKSPARLVEVPVPQAGPGEVLLKVGGNGICQSDLHTMYEWEESPPHLNIELPMTIGHEIGGWVHQLGPGVSGFEVGQACLLTLAGCGHCRSCARGWNNYCENLGKQPGMGLDGGLAEYVVAPVSGLVSLNSLEPWQGAPLTDAGLSSYHAVKRVLPLLVPGSRVVVIGVGGLGHMAVAAIKAISSATIIAVDSSDKALALALELGADDCVAVQADKENSNAGVAAAIGQRVDVVLDFVGGGSTIELAAQLVRPTGHIVVVGRGHGVFNFHHRAMPYGATMSTTFGGSRQELIELIALAEGGAIETRITRFSLLEVESAFASLARGEIRGRGVIVP